MLNAQEFVGDTLRGRCKALSGKYAGFSFPLDPCICTKVAHSVTLHLSGHFSEWDGIFQVTDHKLVFQVTESYTFEDQNLLNVTIFDGKFYQMYYAPSTFLLPRFS